MYLFSIDQSRERTWAIAQLLPSRSQTSYPIFGIAVIPRANFVVDQTESPRLSCVSGLRVYGLVKGLVLNKLIEGQMMLIKIVCFYSLDQTGVGCCNCELFQMFA